MAKPLPGKLANARRRSVAAAEISVNCRPFSEGRTLPMVVEPEGGPCVLTTWAQAEGERIEQLLAEHRALLFRGFQILGSSDFEAFVAATSSGERLAYKDRSTPREDRGDRVYTSTVYPANHTIKQHNEGSYWKQWAKKLYFHATRAASKGGATPLADVQKVLNRLDPAIVDEFDKRGILYVRNYNTGLGLTWQTVFQTESKEVAEEYCRNNDIEFEWWGDGRLRTRARRPAIQRHHRTGDRLWFNHGAFFNIVGLEEETRVAMQAQVAEEELPYNTYFGDGGRIPEATVNTILQAYEDEKTRFSWEVGDVLLIDNMYISHGREPYEGEREVIVAMTEPTSGYAS